MNSNIWLIFLKLSIIFAIFVMEHLILLQKLLIEIQEVWENNREILRLNNSF